MTHSPVQVSSISVLSMSASWTLALLDSTRLDKEPEMKKILITINEHMSYWYPNNTVGILT